MALSTLLGKFTGLKVMPIMKLTLIRHGEMCGDPFICPERPVQGCLTEESGIPQAEAAAQALKDVHFDHAFSSPYGRALQTAEIIMTGRETDIEVLHFLHEWMPSPELASLPSTVYEQIQQQAEDVYAEESWKTDMGEGHFEMSARIIPPFLKELDRLGIHSRMGGFVPEEHARNLSIAVFAHGGSLGTLLNFLLGVRAFPISGFRFELTGVATIDFKERKGIYYPQLRISSIHAIQ
ncbi:histidine phosphatase family protein [Paenibacillus sepulcri]|uniref:Histidine phosphatase family protein n=2 Tax=Paenibacillus sepulcri TaxID=359917 RepID=A0ABS7BVT7_9BACL|nr:histidine phosphatase family protein [Paenibacillus sepulcri]